MKERIAVMMSRRYGFAKASAVERMPMDRMVLLVMRGLGCVSDWITCWLASSSFLVVVLLVVVLLAVY